MISKTILIVCEGQRASEVVQAWLFFLALYFHGYETLGARTGRVFANSALPLYTDMVEKYKKMVLVFVLVRHAWNAEVGKGLSSCEACEDGFESH